MTKQKQHTPQHDRAQTVTASAIGFDASTHKPATTAVAQWVRSLVQNWRQGTVGVKGRSDVARSNKKPWKQKGTGRARAGTARSPLWRGGGVIFGPQPRTRTLTVTKGIKKQAFQHILNTMLSNERVLVFDWQVEGTVPKTAQAARLLKEAHLNNAKIVVFVPMDDYITYASFSNMPQVKVLFFDQANAFDLINADYWLYLQKDSEQFKEMVAKWI